MTIGIQTSLIHPQLAEAAACICTIYTYLRDFLSTRRALVRAPLPSKHAKRRRTMSSLARYYTTMPANLECGARFVSRLKFGRKTMRFPMRTMGNFHLQRINQSPFINFSIYHAQYRRETIFNIYFPLLDA